MNTFNKKNLRGLLWKNYLRNVNKVEVVHRPVFCAYMLALKDGLDKKKARSGGAELLEVLLVEGWIVDSAGI